MTAPWFAPRPAPARPKLRLVCVPFAGGGIGIYRTWPEAMGEDVHVLSVQLPGREARLREPAFTSMRALVPELLAATLPYADLPLVVYGHSMGAAVAHELSLALRDAGKTPRRLIVSARRAPTEPPTHPPLFALPEPTLIAEVERRYGPFPAVLKEHPALLSSFLPTMRADFQLLDTYQPSASAPLPCPIDAFAGDDDHAVPAHSLRAWAACTTGDFGLTVLPGGHFFVRDDHATRDRIAAIVRDEAARL